MLEGVINAPSLAPTNNAIKVITKTNTFAYIYSEMFTAEITNL